MTDRGTPTPEDVANKPTRKVLTLANGLIATGALVLSGVFVDSFVRPLLEDGFSNSPETTLVLGYQDEAVALGRAGQLDQIPQKFDAQKVKVAYEVFDAEAKRSSLDTAGLIVGTTILVAGALKSPRRTR